MQKLESVQQEMTELEQVLTKHFLTLSTVTVAQPRQDSDTVFFTLTLSTDGGEECFSLKDEEDKGKSCKLHLNITGFGRQFCEFNLLPDGNVLQHCTARTVVNYIINLLFANGYRMTRKPNSDSGSAHNSLWGKED